MDINDNLLQTNPPRQQPPEITYEYKIPEEYCPPENYACALLSGIKI
jgi:hypothetical protein